MKARLLLVLMFATLFAFVSHPLPASAATAEVIAFSPPDCTGTTKSTNCTNFLNNVLPNISGIGLVVRWSDVDNCSTTGPCTGGLHPYNWSAIETPLAAYTGSGKWSGYCVGGTTTCKIVLLIQPESDASGTGASNTFTPAYVFTSTYSSNIGAPAPQDVAACAAFPGTGSLPYTGTPVSGVDVVVWNTNRCRVKAGSNLACSCLTSNCGITNFSAFPVVYEKPMVTAYQGFLSALASRYSSSGGGYTSVGQYISYVRPGMSLGAENQPLCTEVSGSLALPGWTANTSIPAGYAIKPSGQSYSFVAIGAGTTGATAPSWSTTPGDRSTVETSATPFHWENVGTRTTGGTATWPDYNGEFVTGTSGSYTDNGYLSQWNSTTPGYIANMVQFLAGLTTTDSLAWQWAISSHYGPNTDVSYADSEASMVNALGNRSVGFGMESLSIEDQVTYNGGVGAFPNTREDWAENFMNYSAVPFHYLQTNMPGASPFASGFAVISISVSGSTATINCVHNCSTFEGQYVYITNSNSNFNGVQQITGGSGSTLTFTTAAGSGYFGAGIAVWSPNYWPTTFPFAVTTISPGANALEVNECDLDFAYSTTTTSSCNSNVITTGQSAYQTAVSNAQ